jgi:hypothetical protein
VKTFLIYEGKRIACKTPFVGADHAVVDGACPLCKATPFKIAGTGRRPSADDLAWEADAVACCCDQPVGIVRAEPNTLFGVREDARIAQMGVRIY